VAFKIERALTGMLDVLKLRSQGRLPYDMAEFVQPSFDINPWVLQAIEPEIEVICPVTAGTVVGQTISYTQPDDWLVVLPQAIGTSGGAGDYLIPQVLWSPPGAPGTVCVADCRRWGATGSHTTAAALEIAVTDYNPFTWFFSSKGSVWYTRVNLIAIAAGPTIEGRVAHYSLDRQ